jgi:hypothetical protein
MIYTSRFQNPELKTGNYTVVGIVRGLPRFRLGYERAGNIIDIAPPRAIFNIYDKEEFTKPYMAHLDEIGVEKISEQLQQYTALGKDVVLCCYEDVREIGEWCHRQLFAKWWFEKTGEVIAELKDESPIKGTPFATKNNKVDTFSKEVSDSSLNTEDKSNDTTDIPDNGKILIRIEYSVWKPREHLPYIGGDVYYQIDRKTGKQTRLFDKEARELISEGKADVWLDYDTIEKLRFVLLKDSTVRVYRVNKKGMEKEIDLKDAIELASIGMLNILDIVTE